MYFFLNLVYRDIICTHNRLIKQFKIYKKKQTILHRQNISKSELDNHRNRGKINTPKPGLNKLHSPGLVQAIQQLEAQSTEPASFTCHFVLRNCY